MYYFRTLLMIACVLAIGTAANAAAADDLGPGAVSYLHCDISDQAEVVRVVDEAAGRVFHQALPAVERGVVASTASSGARQRSHGYRAVHRKPTPRSAYAQRP